MDDKQADDLRPHRASIRRVMRERKCGAEEATIYCAARCGPKHMESIDRLVAAMKQILEKEARID